MPSETMDSQGLAPSSFFSEELLFPDERQVGFWKTDSIPNSHGPKMDGTLHTAGVVSLPLENRIPSDSRMAKCFDLPDSFRNQDQRGSVTKEKHVVGAAGAASHSLPRNIDHDLGSRTNFGMEPASYYMEGEKSNLFGAQCENGLFSSSLSELFSRKLRLSSNTPPYCHSMDAAATQYEEEDPFESLEELEAHTIGNLLPDDDDLISGVTDGIDYIVQPNNGDDVEDLDVFSSIGGLELGEDGLPSGQSNSDLSSGDANGVGSVGGEHPFGEHPSRTLFVRNINSNVEDSELHALFEQYGDIRTLYTACKHRGFVMISYYDIRAARNAMRALQNEPLRHRKLDIHFSIPKDNSSEKDINQGTLMIFNPDSSVSNDELRKMFGVYGEIKEIRETPNRSHHKFIEFYDVRAAEAALRALGRSGIAGKQIKLEPSRPSGARRLTQAFTSELEQESGFCLPQTSPPTASTGFSGPFSNGAITSSMDNGTIFGSHSASGATVTPFFENAFHRGASFTAPNGLLSLIRAGSSGNQARIGESVHSQGDMKLEFGRVPNFRPHSLPDYHDGLGNGVPCDSPGHMASNVNARQSEIVDNPQFCGVGSNGHPGELNEGVFGPSGNGSCPPPGYHYMWSNRHHPQPQSIIWPNSPSFVNGVHTPHPQQLHAVPRAPNQMLNALLPISSHHVGSAPSVNPSLWDRRHAYAGESSNASMFHPGSLGNVRISSNSSHPLEFVHHNVFPSSGGSSVDLAVPSKNVVFNSLPHRCMMFPTRGQMIPMINSFDSPNERTRNRRNEGNSSQGDNKKQFELDIDRIVRGEDKRTTLMIKNIPNKYTSKMLLAAIDERHRGTYDFIYLPIDFKNKCNVGYAFINMTDPSLIIPFYQAFNGKKWEKFNSEKVASLAYARIQGKAALIAHFQNSSLMNEDKRCRPILFHTDGPNAGDQVPFPMGVNVRPRPSKVRATTSEDNSQDSPQNLPNGDLYCTGVSASGSVKESD